MLLCYGEVAALPKSYSRPKMIEFNAALLQVGNHGACVRWAWAVTVQVEDESALAALRRVGRRR